MQRPWQPALGGLSARADSRRGGPGGCSSRGVSAVQPRTGSARLRAAAGPMRTHDRQLFLPGPSIASDGAADGIREQINFQRQRKQPGRDRDACRSQRHPLGALCTVRCRQTPQRHPRAPRWRPIPAHARAARLRCASRAAHMYTARPAIAPSSGGRQRSQIPCAAESARAATRLFTGLRDRRRQSPRSHCYARRHARRTPQSSAHHTYAPTASLRPHAPPPRRDVRAPSAPSRCAHSDCTSAARRRARGSISVPRRVSVGELGPTRRSGWRPCTRGRPACRSSRCVHSPAPARLPLPRAISARAPSRQPAPPDPLRTYRHHRVLIPLVLHQRRLRSASRPYSN
ncbi:hypothetical protein FA95DRAFT_478137 [Auriscalpium vulgare]|uniref:Uncharacterized protein n=1 Tax=Auriscalpium vulgare TaxID=40419 RepID=A0ACB8SBV7_9AGAM|nr:hypothetical protein FA95DRAFT_478137 [Auriscalpium vulgare]